MNYKGPIYPSVETPWRDYGWLRRYHPKDKGRNPKFSESDQLILDLKNYQRQGLNDAYLALRPAVEQILDSDCYKSFNNDRDIVLVSVPGHSDLANRLRPLDMVAAEIAARVEGVQAQQDVLRRRIDVPSLHSGGNRDWRQQKGSIYCYSPESIRGRIVLVLDDVVVSGSTLTACCGVICDEGAQECGGLAIGNAKRQ